MRFFYDTEFHEDGTTIDLISIGIVAEDGSAFYAVNADANWGRISEHQWLASNVLPHLPGVCVDDPYTWQLDMTHEHVMPKRVIAQQVQRFIESYGHDRRDHELWAWYGAYDHVALAQLFGRMLDLPDSIPMHTCDLKQLAGDIELPKQTGDEHNALADARWNADSYRWLTNRARQGGSTEIGALYRAAHQHAEAADKVIQAISRTWQGVSIEGRSEVHRLLRGTPLPKLLDMLVEYVGE